MIRRCCYRLTCGLIDFIFSGSGVEEKVEKMPEKGAEITKLRGKVAFGKQLLSDITSLFAPIAPFCGYPVRFIQ